MSAYPDNYRERPYAPLVCVECFDPLAPEYAEERCGDTYCGWCAEKYDSRFIPEPSDEEERISEIGCLGLAANAQQPCSELTT